MRKKALKLAISLSVAAAVVGFGSNSAFAQNTGEAVTVLGKQVNLLWVVIGATLVIFMQAGFALVETGFCRAKHAAHVMTTNFAIFGLGFIGFFFVGFPLAFGGFSYGALGIDKAIGGNLIGHGSTALFFKGGWALSGGGITPALLGFFLYMVAFMDTVATIPTGAMAERWKWGSFVVWGFFCGAIYYPIMAAWTWGGGWLAQSWRSMHLGAGYVDFAGSGVVHAVGGVAALAGAIVLGPRIGKFGPDGKPRAMPGHHIPMAMLGTLILLFGWFGFNAASTFAATDVQFATVATNTAIAAAFGAVVAMFWITKRTGKPDPGMMANGMLGGLVAITAPCAFVTPWAAAIIGGIAGILVIESVFFVERKLKLDDPVGAISVHGVCGTFGVLCVGIFANGSYGGGWNGSPVTGVKGIIKGEWGQLGAQALGAAVIWTVILGVAFAFFKIQDTISKARGKGGIRSKEEDEIMGLDLPEMGVQAYPEFTK
ncbi:MAG: ammonium transporter [Actinomycetota bacterium]